MLDVAAFVLLLAWFRVAASGRPARIRVPMLAGLALAALGQAVPLVTGPAAALLGSDHPKIAAFRRAVERANASLVARAAA